MVRAVEINFPPPIEEVVEEVAEERAVEEDGDESESEVEPEAEEEIDAERFANDPEYRFLVMGYDDEVESDDEDFLTHSGTTTQGIPFSVSSVGVMFDHRDQMRQMFPHLIRNAQQSNSSSESEEEEYEDDLAIPLHLITFAGEERNKPTTTSTTEREVEGKEECSKPTTTSTTEREVEGKEECSKPTTTSTEEREVEEEKDLIMNEQKKHTLYNEIVKASQNSDYEKGIKSCNRLLHEFPEESTAFEAKIVCCIHVSKFQEALDFISKTPKLAGNLWFEKAYCYYRLNRIQEAKEALEKTTDDSLRRRELMAQILYRLEDYENCFDMYKEVIKGSSDEYENERQTNLAAICACLGLIGSRKPIPSLPADTYELAYNAACLLAAKGEFGKAETLLSKAEDLCTEFLREDGLGDDEIEEELCILRIQKAYCSQKLGKEKEALSAYLRLLKSKPSDVSLIAVASNNVLSLNRDQNIFESKKRIKAMHSEGVSAKLTRDQQKNMIINQILFYLYTGQYAVCKEGCQKLGERYPETMEDSMMLTAALASKTGGIELAKQEVENFIKKNPESAKRIQLGLIQDLLRQGNRSEAISMLKELLKSSYDLGIISSLVVLYQADDKIQEAADLLKDAVQHFKKRNDKGIMNMLWRQAAALRMQKGDYAEAVKSLEELLKAAPDDKVTLAQSVLACAQYDMDKAQKLSKLLPPPPQAPLMDEFDLEGIETPNWLTNAKIMKKPGGKGDATPPSPIFRKTPGKTNDDGSTVVLKPKKKKNKKPKLPKNFDPTRDVDPERWLPKYMRSGFKPKKVRKTRVEVAKGTQGTAAGGQDTVYDMSVRLTPSGTKLPVGGGPKVLTGSGSTSRLPSATAPKHASSNPASPSISSTSISNSTSLANDSPPTAPSSQGHTKTSGKSKKKR